MNWKCGQEVSSFLIRLENGHGRTIGFQRPDDLLEASVATFGQVQLLQELTDPAVTVAAAGCPVVFQPLDADGTVSTGMAENLNPVGQDTDFDGFPDICGG